MSEGEGVPPIQFEAKPDEPEKPVEHFVFVKAECGCRFQIVSALPVLAAGVLAMPDIAANVCDTHRAKQEAAQEQAKEDAKKPQIVGPDGHTVVRTRDR